MIAVHGARCLRLLVLWLLALLLLNLVPVHGLTPSAIAGIGLNLDKELHLLRDGGYVPIHISGARYRFSVFTFEDPDDTGLGNAFATIISHDLLANNKVSSVGVLRYMGKLGKASDEQQLRYFDKVEQLIESQGVQIAVWGMIQRTDKGIRVDSYVQLSPSIMQKAFNFSFQPSRGMRDALIHRIGPDRMLVQRKEFTYEEMESLVAVARGLGELRAAPYDNAPIAAVLPIDKVYYLIKKHDNWVKISIQDGKLDWLRNLILSVWDVNFWNRKSGWLRTDNFCPSTCASLLDVSQFASELMAYVEHKHRIPNHSSSLADDAKAFIDQLLAIDALDHASYERAMNILLPWCDPQSSVPSPGGAATCNLRALVQIVWVFRASVASDRYFFTGPWDTIRKVTEQLAKDSLSDPRHVPTLSNLAILFGWLSRYHDGLYTDNERAELASQLAESARASMNE